MILSNFSTSNIEEAQIIAYRQIISEAGYARALSFTYPPFNVDPTPSVLVLGHYIHPNTKNKLLGGINLNYLTQSQVDRLRKSLPKLVKSGRSLKTRYRWGKRYLPDIFKEYYRTYDEKYIHAVHPSTLRFWHPKADKRRKEEPVARPRIQIPDKSAEVQQSTQPSTIKALQPNVPQGTKVALAKPQKQELDALDQELVQTDVLSKDPRVQNAKMNPMPDPQVARSGMSKKLLKQQPQPEEPEPIEPEIEPELDELGEGCHFDQDLGYIWDTPKSYILWHSKPKFHKIDDGVGELVAIKNIRENKVIFGRENYHAMLVEANWDYQDVEIYHKADR